MASDNGGPLTVLVVGDWLAHWAKRPDVRVTGWCRACGDTPDSAPEPDIPSFDTPEEALARQAPAMAAVLTPPWCKTSVSMVEMLVRRGCDVFLEKFRPAVPGDSRRLLALSRETGRRIVIGDSYHLQPPVEQAKRWIADGRLGEIERIVWRCDRPRLDAFWMSAYRHVLLEDLAYHHLSALHYMIAGRFERVFALSRAAERGAERELSGDASVRADVSLTAWNGHTHLHYGASWSSRLNVTDWLGKFRIEGRSGTLSYGDGRLAFRGRDGDERIVELPPYEDGRAKLAETFRRLARQRGEPSHMDVERMLPALDVMDAAAASADSGRPEEVAT